MAVEIVVRKLYDTLVPVDTCQLEVMEELKMNGEYKAVLTQPRNLGFHKKFFALLNTCYKNYEQPEVFYQGARVFKSLDRFREEIIIGCGYWELGLDKKNRVIQVAKSISFAKMDQLQFEQLFRKAIDVILADYLPNYDREDMDSMIDEILRFT
jgi:glycogen debranching enzyme